MNSLERGSTTRKDAQKLYREVWQLSGHKNLEALAGLKRMDEELIECIDLSGGENLSGTSTSNCNRLFRKRPSAQMAKEDAKKLSDIESYIKSMRKK